MPVVEISEPVNTFRLAHKKSPALSQLVDDANELSFRKRIRELINDLSRTKHTELSEPGAHEPTHGINAEIINTTFSLSRRGGGGRFNDGARGAWYCAFECQTTIEEVAYHRTCIMDRTGVYEDEVVYHELLAEFAGSFHDARGLPRDKGILGNEPNDAYPLGQKLTRELIVEGGRGIIYPSVRRQKGTCLVAFHPQMVQNLRFGKR